MILKHRDREILRFAWSGTDGVKILSVNDAERRFLPLEMKGQATEEALWTWLAKRTVPRGRAYIQNFLANVGLRADDVGGIIRFCRGLSLNDVYWVTEDGSTDSWADVNLYTHPFSETLSYMAFTGAGGVVSPGSTSPELTTNGMLAKCWHNAHGEVLLYKSGTEGAANAGFEPYSEFYAAQLAEVLGLSHVKYGLSMFKKRLCSTCPLFTSDKYGYLPAGRLVSKEEALADRRFADIFLFDALICNPDRHLGNFGYIVDNDVNGIVGAAPIFDNGYGLFSLALFRNRYVDEFADLGKFAASRSPALYPQWLEIPGGISNEMRERVKRAVGFRFKRHPNYNLPSERLKLIEDFIQRRVSEIAGNTDGGRKDCQIVQSCDNVKSKTSLARDNVNAGDSGLESIVANMQADPFITYDDLAELVGVSKATIIRRVSLLRQAGRVVRVGADKNGSWKVLP